MTNVINGNIQLTQDQLGVIPWGKGGNPIGKGGKKGGGKGGKAGGKAGGKGGGGKGGKVAANQP